MAASVCRELEFLHLKEHGAPIANVIMYAVIKKFYKERNVSPDIAALEVELIRYMSDKMVPAGSQASIQKHLDMFKTLYPKVDARSEGPVRDLAKRIIQARIIKPQVAALAQGYADGGSVQDLSTRIKELEAKQMSINGGRLMTGVVSRVVSDSGERIATGLPWIDPYLGGGRGPVLGCALAILAPQGGFKTGNGIQMVVAQALQSRYSLLVLAEEGFTKNIQRRIWAYITKVKTSEIEACNDNLEEVVKKHGLDAAAMAKKLAAVDKHLHVLDLLQHPGDIGAITAEVEHMESSGMKPMYVYVDWAGPIADRMMSSAESGRKYEKKYDALKDLAFQLAQLAGRKNMILAVSHQMAAENVKKGPFAENDQYCAAECRSFTEQFKYVLTVNAKDPKTGLQLMNIAKARDDPNNVKVILRCDGATSTTSDVSAEFERRGTKFIEKNKKAATLPVEVKSFIDEEK